MDWTLGRGVTILSAQDVHAVSPGATAERIRSIAGSAPAYLSFDIDALDPAFAPGTGTPEIGGLASWQAQAILRGLGGVRFVGMDIVEDTVYITTHWGSCCLFALLLQLCHVDEWVNRSEVTLSGVRDENSSDLLGECSTRSFGRCATHWKQSG